MSPSEGQCGPKRLESYVTGKRREMRAEHWEAILRVLSSLTQYVALTGAVIFVIGLILLCLWTTFNYIRDHIRNPDSKTPDYFGKAELTKFLQESGHVRVIKILDHLPFILGSIALFLMSFFIVSILLKALLHSE